MSKQIVTPEFRLSFPALFAPAVNKADPSKPPKYGATMLFSKSVDLSGLKTLMLECAKEKWGQDMSKIKLKNPILDGDAKMAERAEDGKAAWDGYLGCVFIRTTTEIKPGVFDQNCKEIPALEQKRVYAGMYCRAQVHCFAWENTGKRGVSFGIDNIQIIRNGDPFAGGMDEIDAVKTFGIVPDGKNDPAKYTPTPTGTDANNPFN